MGKLIQDQILGMKWLNALIGKGLSALGLDTATRWGGSIQFFLYDVIKITILLCLLRIILSQIFIREKMSRSISMQQAI